MKGESLRGKKVAATGHTHTAFPGKAGAASGTRLDAERPTAKHRSPDRLLAAGNKRQEEVQKLSHLWAFGNRTRDPA